MNAAIVQPSTVGEQDATQAFLSYVQGVLDWGRLGWSRAKIAMESTACK